MKVGGHTLCSILVLSFFLCYLSISLLLFCSGCKDILDSLLCCIYNANRRIIMCFEARLNQVVLIFCSAFPQLFLSTWNVSVCSSSTQSLIELSLCLSSFNLDKLSLSVFELSCVDFLFIFLFLLK